MTENIINNLQNFKSISPSDIRVLDAIKQITRKRAYYLQSWFARTAADSSAQRSGIPPTATVALFGSATINSKAVNAV